MKNFLFALLAFFAAFQFAFAAVDINTATEAELDKLPGIGPVKAKAIVEDRKKNGPFKTAEDLKRVKGIGDKIFEGLKSEVSVAGGGAAPKPDTKPAAVPKADAKPAAAPAAKPAAETPKSGADAKKDAKK